MLELLATRLTSNVRDLQSAIDQLDSYSGLTSQAVTRELAIMVLRALGAEQVRAERTSLERVLQSVAAHYRLSVGDLTSRKRTKDVALARQMAMYAARELSDASLAQIGAALSRDHSTVAHGCAKIAQRLPDEPALSAAFEAIRAALAGNPAPERVARRPQRDAPLLPRDDHGRRRADVQIVGIHAHDHDAQLVGAGQQARRAEIAQHTVDHGRVGDL